MQTCRAVDMSFDHTIALVRRQWRLVRLMAWTSWVLGQGNWLGRWAPDRERHDDRWKARWAEGVRKIVGLDMRVVEGQASWSSPRGRLVIANHRSPLDIVALMNLFGGHFLANHRVANAPIIGKGSRRIGTVFVDRSDRWSGANAIRAMRRLLARGRTLIVFPEGTTFGGDEVRPFKGGGFAAASGLGIDVIPVGIAYTPGHEFASGRTGDHVRSFLSRPRTPVWIAIGEPVPFPAQRKAVEEAFRQRVQALVHRARAAADLDLGMVGSARTVGEAGSPGAARGDAPASPIASPAMAPGLSMSGSIPVSGEAEHRRTDVAP